MPHTSTQSAKTLQSLLDTHSAAWRTLNVICGKLSAYEDTLTDLTAAPTPERAALFAAENIAGDKLTDAESALMAYPVKTGEELAQILLALIGPNPGALSHLSGRETSALARMAGNALKSGSLSSLP